MYGEKKKQMVKGLREKQYQLAAQKRNEAHLRFNYYSQIAGYFERECAITKQYNSWVAKDRETSSSYLQKKVKEKKLQARQEKLRRLLDDEERQYRQECEDLARNRRHQQQCHELPTLEALKQKLLERRAERNLYLPSSRRRYQNYFYNSDSLIDPPRKESVPKDRYSASRMNFQGTCHENEFSQSRSSSGSQHLNRPLHNERSNFFSATYARNIRRTLEETNLQDEASETKEVDVPDFANQLTISGNQHNGPETIVEENCVMLKDEETSVDENEIQNKLKSNASVESLNNSYTKSSIDNLNVSKSKMSADNTTEINKTINLEEDKHIHDNSNPSSPKHHMFCPENQKDQGSYQYYSKVDDKDAKNAIEHWQNERSLPWSRKGDIREQNLSIPMFLYLMHDEMKSKILDLSKRERQACKSYKWEEALRFRDMKNRLNMSREIHLLNAAGLDLDEDTRNNGLRSIKEREKIISEREKVCSNGSFYSEEAKELWQKWVEEDRKIEKDESYIQREILMEKLEIEWKALAIEDKDRISNLYEKTKYDSSLQKEHNLMK